MRDDRGLIEFPKGICLTDEDLYRYISGQGGTEKLHMAETHLAQCSDCRQNLSELLEILHPDAAQPVGETSEFSKAEADQALELIQKTSWRERSDGRRLAQRFRWPIAAAAAICFVALGFWTFKYLYETNRSESFFYQARTILEQNYSGSSPGKLRLALPFHSASTYRGNAEPESLHRAENLFFQALAFRENMVEAHLGLACIYLNEAKHARAREEFQKVLNVHKGSVQALIGRGVAQYEEARQSSDPVRRNALLAGSLDDFDAALKLYPNSPEARYNRVWTLFESGLHKEALEEIERYLSRDPGSMWAEALRSLKYRMQATQIGAVEEEVGRFVSGRNESALAELARQAPCQIPAAIVFAMRKSLEPDQASVARGSLNSEDWRWAARIMEAAYSAATGDSSFKAFLDFYVGLSPPQRALKRTLDEKFQNLLRLHRNSKFANVLRSSTPLELQYSKLKDFWQVANLHHLRGSSFYLGRADFGAAEAEFRKMLEIASQLNTPDLMAKALGSLAMIYGMQRKFDDSLSFANRLESLAQAHNLESWQAYARMIRGNQFRRMGQFEQSLHEYTRALAIACRLLDGMKIVEILEDLGIAMDRLGRVEDAESFYKLALRRQESFLKSGVVQPIPEMTVRRLNLLFEEGELAMRRGDFTSARTFFEESLKSTPSGMRELEGRNRLGLAEIYLGTNRFREAEDMLRSVIAISAAGQYSEIEWQARSLEGRLLEQTGHRGQAMLSLRQAIDILERMRRDIKPEDLRESFLTDRFDPFKTMVALLYDSGDKRKTLEFVDRAKSMTLRDHLRQQYLASGMPRDSLYAGEKKNTYPTVEYFFTNEGLLIFLTRDGHIESVSQSISTAEISRQIQSYLEAVRRNNTEAFESTARLLYDELIAPIEKHAFTDSVQTLVILPDGPLHLLPFAGLLDRQGHFLIEKAAVAFAPSRSVFRHCLLSSRPDAVENHSAALIDGSAGLPSAQEELNYLSKLYGRNAAILAPRNLPAFGQAVAHSGIVHFSGHAIDIKGRPALLLQTSPSEIYLDCKTISAWKIPRAYLVNLAGCSTGIGPLSEGEAPWGLIPAFLNAGAPAIIASLMPVDDTATEHLSRRFYDQLQKGIGKARALQAAQLAELESARSNSDLKPQSWIPYILVGNPQ